MCIFFGVKNTKMCMSDAPKTLWSPTGYKPRGSSTTFRRAEPSEAHPTTLLWSFEGYPPHSSTDKDPGFLRRRVKRLKEHNNRLVKSTAKRAPLVLIYNEEYNDLSEARRREDYLKSLYGYREREKIVKEYFRQRSALYKNFL